jgi:hypothetical protein
MHDDHAGSNANGKQRTLQSQKSSWTQNTRYFEGLATGKEARFAWTGFDVKQKNLG